jgi:hypothetical protein
MKRLLNYLLPLVVAAVLLGGTVAQAGTLYSFNFATIDASNPVGAISGTGVFDVDSNGVIVAITNSDFHLGDVDQGPMTLTFPVPGFASNDNAFTGATPYLTINGLSFVVAGVNYNIFNNNPGNGNYADTGCPIGDNCITNNVYGQPSTPISFTAAEIPEPASLFTIGTGLLGLGLVGRKRRKAAQSARVGIHLVK